MRDRLDVIARWALSALPGIDGVVLAVLVPSGLVAGSAGLADDVDPANPHFLPGTRVERALPMSFGGCGIGTLTLYSCDLPGGGPVDADVGWLAGIVAGAAAQMIAQSLLPTPPTTVPARAPGAVPFAFLGAGPAVELPPAGAAD